MPDKILKGKRDKLNFFDYFTEVIGWLQIVASPLLTGLFIAAWIYFSNQTLLRLIIAVTVVIVALITGILLAVKIWKKQGTVNFFSGISAPKPEPGSPDDKKDNKV